VYNFESQFKARPGVEIFNGAVRRETARAFQTELHASFVQWSSGLVSMTIYPHGFYNAVESAPGVPRKFCDVRSVREWYESNPGVFCPFVWD
jgi:hypothetical protein